MDSLASFRAELNELDEQIIRLLGKRFGICAAVAEFKQQHGIPMMHPGRVSEVKDRVAAAADRCGVDPAFARALYTLIINEACRLEDAIIGRPTDDEKEVLA